MRHRPMCLLCMAVILWVLAVRGKGEEEDLFPPGLEGTHLTVVGQVCRVENKEKNQHLYLKHISGNTSEESLNLSKILIITKEEQEIKIGNWVRAAGVCSALQKPSNPGQFDMKAYYRLQGVGMLLKKAGVQIVDHSTDWPRQSIADWKKAFSGGLNLALGERYGSVMSAMLLGEKSGMDGEIKQLFQAGGISHILAISGLHISMIGMGLYGLVRKLTGGFLIPAGISGSLLLLYGVMTGMPVSACRAIIMFLVYLGAQILGRTYDLLSAMSLAGILILLQEPLYLFQAGFQLSFLAVLGIGLLLPILRELLPGPYKVRNVLCGGLSVQIMTLPCSLYWFSEFAPGGFLLNLVILPLAGTAMASGAAAGLLACFWEEAGILAGAPCHYVLTLYEELCRKSAELSGSFGVWGSPGLWKLSVCYGITAALLLCEVSFQNKKRQLPDRDSQKVEKYGRGSRRLLWGLGMMGSLFLLHLRVTSGLEMTFLDVGQGDSIFWRTETGRTYLCDGGSSTESGVGTYRIEPFLKWIGTGTLDYILATHMDADHINGIREILMPHVGGISVGCLVLPKIRTEDPAFAELKKLAEERAIPVLYLSRGTVLKDGNLSIQCLWPESQTRVEKEKKNESSLVLQMNYGGFQALLTGDLEGKGEEELLNLGRLSRTDLLKVAHHGSSGATSEPFLDRTKPAAAILSYGNGNSYGHPHPELTERLEKEGCRIYATALSGAVTVKSDGSVYQIYSFK